MNTSNVIVGVVSNGNYNVVGTITQWDYGYIFRIEGVELPAVYRVDFATDRYYGEALTVYGNEDGAEIPEELIATGKDIYAFYYFIGDGYGKTAHTWRIQNDLRPRISDKQPTPSQQDSIDQAIVRINEAVETVEEAAQNAREDADFLRNASAEATTLPSRSEATAVYSKGVFSFGIPKGIDAITMDVQTEAILIHANSDGRLKANTIVEIKFKVHDGDTLVTPTAIDATTLEGTPPVAIRSTTNKVTYHLPYNKQMQYDNGSVTISATYGGKTITHVIPYAVIKVIVESLKHVKDDSSDNGGVIEGNVTANSAAGLYAHAEGRETTANASYAHAEGYFTTVSAMCGHAEGAGNTVSGDNAHAEGSGNTITASGLGAHAEGNNTTVSARWAHAEGGGTTVSGECAHAEGAGTRATGGQSHSEGGGTLASGAQSHAEGASTTASGDNSHAENLATTASGACSHASGVGTIAQRKSQFVIGECNKPDLYGADMKSKGEYVFIVGNGDYGNTSNAFAIKWDGTLVFGNGTEITPAQFSALLALLSN